MRGNEHDDVAQAMMAGAARMTAGNGRALPGVPDALQSRIIPETCLPQTRLAQLRAARTRILLTTALTTALAGIIPHQAKAATACTANITASCTNTGIISGNIGILNDDGSIGTLSNSGTISGSSTGIYNEDGSIGTLSNSGTIYNPSYDGVGYSASGDAIVNSGEIEDFDNSGTIFGGETGILNNGSIGALSNSGTIFGGYWNGILNGVDGSIGTLSNSGVLSGWTGAVYNDGTIGTLSNSGTITSPIYDGIYNKGTISSLTNGSTGIISGRTDGIANFGYSSGTLTYTGSIGTLSNSGTITGGDVGIVNGFYGEGEGEGSIGTLSNSGTIAGGYTGIYNDEGSIGTLSNSGTISGDEFGIYSADGSIGALINSGTISGDDIGIANFGYSSGTLTYTGSIGTLINSGTIAGSGFAGIANVYDSSIGTLINSGLIYGSIAGIYNGFGGEDDSSIGTLSNSGTISGGNTGIYNGDASIGVLANSGSISGADTGVYNEGGTIGTLIDAGSITSAGANVIASGETLTGTALSVDNTDGTIGALIGAGLYNGADGVSITNSGTVTGSTSNVSITGNAAGSTIVTGLYNTGTISALTNDSTGIISGSTYGIDNEGSIGALSNSGMITGAQDALYIASGGSVGLLTDSGTIAGNIDNESSLALTISGGTGTDYGTLTGYDGATGSITSTIAGADLAFGTGNLLLDDNINVGSNSVIDTGATLLVNGQISIASSNPLDIEGGLLEVGDSTDSGAVLTSNVAIGSAGELRGHGTIAGNVTNDGVVYPGGSVGVLTIDGNYVQNSDGTLEVEVSPDTTAGTGYDQLAVTGSSSLAGSLKVNVDDGSYTVGDEYDILTAAGGVSGTFSSASYTASFSTALEKYLTPVLDYTADNVYLELTPTTTTSTTGTTTTTGDLSKAPAFSTGRFYAASAYAQNSALQSVLGAPLGMDSGENEVDRGYWLHGIGNFGSDNGYDFNAKGFVIGKGFDVSPDLVIGGAVSNVYTSTNGGGSSVDGTSFGALVYGLYNAGRLNLSASAATGHMSDNINRYLPSLGWNAKAASNGAYEGAAVQLQYSLLPDNSSYFLAPYAQASYLHTALGSAQETNAGILNLHYDALNTSLAQLGAGLTGGYNVPVKYGVLTAWASLGGLGTLGNPHVSVTEQLGTYAARETALAAPVGAFTPGVGLQLQGNGPWRLAAGWGGQFGSATSAENLTLQASYKW